MRRRSCAITVLAAVMILSLGLSGCTEVDQVSYNISKEADNFNVIRRLVVINARTNTPTFELIGAFSVQTDEMSGKVDIVVEVEEGLYKKHFIWITDGVIMHVEDIEGAEVSKYRYEVNFLPEQIVPIEFTSND